MEGDSKQEAGADGRRQKLRGRGRWEETATRRPGKMGGDSKQEVGEDGKRQPPGSRG